MSYNFECYFIWLCYVYLEGDDGNGVFFLDLKALKSKEEEDGEIICFLEMTDTLSFKHFL